MGYKCRLSISFSRFSQNYKNATYALLPLNRQYHPQGQYAVHRFLISDVCMLLVYYTTCVNIQCIVTYCYFVTGHNCIKQTRQIRNSLSTVQNYSHTVFLAQRVYCILAGNTEYISACIILNIAQHYIPATTCLVVCGEEHIHSKLSVLAPCRQSEQFKDNVTVQ